MDGGEDGVVMIVLDVGEARLQMRLVVVIDERDGASNLAGVGLLRCSISWARIMSAMASERLS